MEGLLLALGCGGERSRRAHRQGQDVRVTLKLTLKDVIRGTTRKVKLRTLETCASCEGRGGAKGANPTPCRTCRGSSSCVTSPTP